jgi:hypothetical protein
MISPRISFLSGWPNLLTLHPMVSPPNPNVIPCFSKKLLLPTPSCEKNAFLNELKKHAADYSATILESEHLDSAIVDVKANYNKVNEQFQELKNSVAFLTELEFYQAAPDVASLRGMIESLERDISAIGPLPESTSGGHEIHFGLIRCRVFKIIDKGTGTKVRELREICQILTLDDGSQKIADSIERAPTEVLEQLSDKQKVTAIFEEILRGIHEETERDVTAFGKHMEERLAKVKAVPKPILCKVKRSMSSQTFQAKGRKNDVETHYNKTDITRGRKGKFISEFIRFFGISRMSSIGL